MGKIFGEYIRERREALLRNDRRFSIRKLAESIRVHHSYLSKIERGEPGTLSEKKIVALAEALGESPDVLLAMNGRISDDVARAILHNPGLFQEIIINLRGKCAEEVKATDGESVCASMLVRVKRLLGGEHESILRHELRSPLAGIVSAAETILREGVLRGELELLLQEVRDSAKRLVLALDSSLSLALIESGKYDKLAQPVDVVALFDRVRHDLTGLARARGVGMQVLMDGEEVAESREVVAAGSERLCYSIIFNLLRNAMEAAPAGSLVTVNLCFDDHCEMSLHNEGIVPEEVRNVFFDKFSTHGKSDGVGLGTYAAKRMAEAMGGSLTMRSDESLGTTLTVRLPRTH